MPNNFEHNRICKKQGYDKRMCEFVNKWMDEPASKFPGCQHRNFRHSKQDCDFIASEILKRTGIREKAIQGKNICMIHRIVDKRADKGCGCRPLFED